MRVSWWRILLGTAVLALLGFFAVHLVPFYWNNLKLQRFVEEAASHPENREKGEEFLKVAVLEKAESLGLPVRWDNVRIRGGERLRIDVRYVIRVNLPLYTVDLHFYPGAGSR